MLDMCMSYLQLLEVCDTEDFNMFHWHFGWDLVGYLFHAN